MTLGSLVRPLVKPFAKSLVSVAVAAIFGLVAATFVWAEEDDPLLNVGILTSPAPYYGFSEASDEPVGFAIDLWRGVAGNAGLNYRFKYFETRAALLKAVENKTVDVVPLMAIDDESKTLFDFTEPVQASPVSIFTLKSGGRISNAAGLSGRRVSVVNGHVGQALMRTYRGELSIVHDTLSEALNALMTKTTDAVIHQDHIMWQLARRGGIDSLLTTIGPPLETLQLSVAVRRGELALLQTIKPALQRFVQSPAFFASRQAWGGNPPPLVSPVLIAQVLGALLAVAVIGLGLWRHVSILRLNKALAISVAEQQSAEARFRDVAEAASDWFFEQDADFRFTFLSSRFADVTGFSDERLIGQTRWGDAAARGVDIETPAWRDHIQALEAHEDWRDFTYTLMSSEGDPRTITTSGKAIFDENGTFAGYRGVGRDITRRISLENALQQAQKMEVVGQLTGGIAHDFNNLLTVMVGNLEMLRRRVSNDRQSAVYVSTATEAVDIGAELVQRLMMFSRKQSLHPRSADINQLVDGMLPLVRTSLGAPISVELALGDKLPFVFADEAQLQNALLNLAINARDAMPNGGQLRISTEEVAIDARFVEANPGAKAGRYLLLSVEDNGIGISKENLAKVVEPFFTTKEVGKGSGLGLSTIYGFAEQSEGFLLISSAHGKGTTVRLYLPATDTEPQSAADGAKGSHDESAPGGDGRLVLVVEDDERVREVTIARLEGLGYEVIAAANAADALQVLHSETAIDLMLTDIVMPGGMSGIDLAREVNRERPEIKVLFSAGYSKQAETLQSEGKLGPWLRKPYKQADLAQKIREVLDA